MPKMFEAISRQVEYFFPEVKVAAKPAQKNGKFFANLKARLDKLDKSGCVYKIPCKGKLGEKCEKVYIGETINLLGTRMKQHKGDIHNKRETTALCEHAKAAGHECDFEEVQILARERSKKRLRIQEVAQIINYEEVACNYKTDSANFNPTYYSLLKRQRS